MKGKKPKVKKTYPDCKYNPELNKYSNVVLFPKKVEQANELLKKFPPPKELFTL